MQPETALKNRMVTALETSGWLVRKFQGTAHGRKGVPDMIAIKDGFHCWIEVKREGGRLSASQAVEHAILKAFGANVIIAYTPRGAVDGAEAKRAAELLKVASLRPAGRKSKKASSEVPGRN